MKDLPKTLALFFLLLAIGCGGGGSPRNPAPQGDPVVGAIIAFYDAGDVEVARATTDVNGTYSASVPTTARRFHILASSIPTTQYYRSYRYNGKTFAPLIDTCKAPLPNLPTGTTVNLANIGVSKSSGPPPPVPSGCTLPSTGTGTTGSAQVTGKIVGI